MLDFQIKTALLTVVINLSTLLTVPSVLALDQDKLLPVEQAFALTVTAEDVETAVAKWMIADGYYMYRERLRFESLTPGVALGEPRLPVGKIKKDEFFGEMEVYRDTLRAELPLVRRTDVNTLQLKVTSQGCADIGVCYPPVDNIVELKLPPRITPKLTGLGESLGLLSTANPALDLLKLQGNSDGLGSAPLDPALPPPEQAYVVSISERDANTLQAIWTIDPCCYMYRERFAFSSQTSGITLGTPALPPGLDYEDEFYGQTEIYRDRLVVNIPYQRVTDAPAQVDVQVDFQGCADIGVCYPPQQQIVPALLSSQSADDLTGRGSADSALVRAPPVQPILPATVAAQTYVSEQVYIANTLVHQRFWALPLFFGFGLLLAFTPCVFPMIPILSGIIAGQKQLTQRQAFLLSLVYVLAMALTYTAAGVGAALLGQNVQIWFQNPWVLVSFSALFVVLALSMFGLFELQMPVRWQTRLAELSNRQSGGRYAGVAAMGMLSALIVGPCVAAPLIGILSVIGTTGDVALGGTALFVMSLGMGAPLLAIGTSAGKLLPKAGPWMGVIKAAFGVMLLAVAVWMLERILPAAVTLLLWAVLLIITATFMSAGRAVEGERLTLLGKDLGIVFMTYGVLLLVGVAGGGTDPLQPLRGTALGNGLWSAASRPASRPLTFTTIKTLGDLEQQIQFANGRPLMLDFYADWCVSCKELEKYTFSNPSVQAALGDTQLLKADVTANDEADRALLEKFNLIGPPAILFFGSDGKEQPGVRVVGFMPAADFREHLARVDELNSASLAVARTGVLAVGRGPRVGGE